MKLVLPFTEPIPLLRRGAPKGRGSSISENALRFQRERADRPTGKG
jgi:hypothetical protein